MKIYRSETRTIVLYSGGQQARSFLLKKMDEDVPRFALHEGTKDDSIGEQETERTPEQRQIET